MQRVGQRAEGWTGRGAMEQAIRVAVILFLLPGWEGVASPAAEGRAAPVQAMDPLVQHLEFLGYACDQVEAGIRARHLSKIHLYITYAFGGIRLQTGFPGKPPHADVGSRYRVSNALTQRLSVMQVYWSEDGNLFAMAWMPGLYDKARFAVFLEAWDHDTELLREAYDELQPFLREPPEAAPSGP